MNEIQQKFDFERITKINLCILYACAVLLPIESFATKGVVYGIEATSAAFGASIIASILFLLFKKNLINQTVMGTGVSFAPTLSMYALLYFVNGNIRMILIFYICIAMAALYFKKNILLTYAAVFNVSLISYFAVMPQAILGKDWSIQEFAGRLIIINCTIVVLYFLTKWGNELIEFSTKQKEDAEKLTEKLKDVIKQMEESSNVLNDDIKQISSTTEAFALNSQNQAEIVSGFSVSVSKVDKSIHDVTDNMSNISGAINEVSVSIKEMSNAVQDTAMNIGNAASEISGVFSSIQQMDEAVKSISLNSKEAQSEAQNSVNKAKEGNLAVGSTIEEMDKISQSVSNILSEIKVLGDSAQQIGEILNVIDDIAEQTNLLSLNAAIEAARAGDAGKGFAVVASSIRSLAEKSSESTKDISKIIKGIQDEVKNVTVITEDSTCRVDEGLEFVKRTGLAFEEIFKAINNTSSLIQKIARSIQLQEASNDEVMKAVEKLDEIITQLSSTAEQQAAGSNQIVNSVIKINDLIRRAYTATEEQSSSSQELVKLIEEINVNATEISKGSKEISGSTTQLVKQTQELIKVFEEFDLKD